MRSRNNKQGEALDLNDPIGLGRSCVVLIRISNSAIFRREKMEKGKEKYQCQGSPTCGFIYDPERGDRRGKVPKGVPFEKLPDDWRCPCCGVGKDKFKCLDET